MLTEELIASIKRRTLAPVTQKTFTDDDILSAASERLQLSLVSDLLRVRENFFLDFKRTPVLASKQFYTIAERASGVSLKDVFFVDSSGNRSRCIARQDVNSLPEFQSTGAPEFFVIKGDELILLPTPATTDGYLEQWFFRRPSTLAATSTCARITAVTSLAGVTTLTVNTDLTASLSIGSQVDFLSYKSPFLSWADDVAITAITSSSIAVSTTSVSNGASVVEPVVGDYICPAQTANIPMIPLEFHQILAQDTACFLLESLGDLNKLDRANATLEKMRERAFQLVANRVELEVEVAVPRNSIADAISGRFR